MAIRLGFNQPQYLPKVGTNVQKAQEETLNTNTSAKNVRTPDVQVKTLDSQDNEVLLANMGVNINKSGQVNNTGEASMQSKFWYGHSAVNLGDNTGNTQHKGVKEGDTIVIGKKCYIVKEITYRNQYETGFVVEQAPYSR